MDKTIIELITDIMEDGKFKKSKSSDAVLKANLNALFKQHKDEPSSESAKAIYDSIAEIARFGLGEAANKFALKFEKEVGYNDMQGDD
jgi:hypothetical protein